LNFLGQQLFLPERLAMKQIYLRYLVLAEALRKSNIDLSGIDDIGKKLLEAIAIKSAQGQPLVVTQTMELSEIASPATIHRRIEILKKAGLIQVMQTEQNQKIKFLVPTQISIDYFDKLGKLMASATRS
jgi:DNA-binding MarR family transcriptional regulator